MNEEINCGFRRATCFTSQSKFHTSPIVKTSKITDNGERERERERESERDETTS